MSLILAIRSRPSSESPQTAAMSEPFGIVPNRTREGAEPEKVAASIWVFSEKRAYASLLIPNSATAERK